MTNIIETSLDTLGQDNPEAYVLLKGNRRTKVFNGKRNFKLLTGCLHTNGQRASLTRVDISIEWKNKEMTVRPAISCRGFQLLDVEQDGENLAYHMPKGMISAWSQNREHFDFVFSTKLCSGEDLDLTVLKVVITLENGVEIHQSFPGGAHETFGLEVVKSGRL